MPTIQTQKNHAQEEKDDELMKNISNYTNLLEQQLLLDTVNPTASVDSTASSSILMTNLSASDSDKQIYSKKTEPASRQNQKSVLGGKVFKFKEATPK